MGTIVKISSWNVNGLGSYTKRRKVLQYLKQKNADVIMLQETHLLEKDTVRVKDRWVGQAYHNTFTQKKRGVSILFSKHLKIQVDKEFKDKEGRVIILLVNLFGQHIIIGNIYAPNVEDPDFFLQLKKTFIDFGDYPIIMAGDFNQVLDVFLDKSGISVPNANKTQEAIKSLCKDTGLLDVWRLLNPSARDYTFFSNRHSVYSRIDYFLLSHSLIESVGNCSIGTIALTDHAPIDLVLQLGSHQERSKGWRMNTSILNDAKFCAQLQDLINEYFEINDNTAEQGSIWDGFKAYIRGILIQHSSSIKKQDKQRITSCEEDIKNLEKEYRENFNPSVLNRLVRAKYELNTIFSKKAEYSLFRIKQKWYESGEKASKLLANQLKAQQAARQISAIKNDTGNIVTSQKEINKVFKEFYKKLYSHEGQFDINLAGEFFAKLNLPKLSEENVNILEGPITLEELNKAIKISPNGKTPGLDGIPNEFYKHFISELGPELLKTFNTAVVSGHLPSSMTESLITIILKKGKNPLDCGSYRPISLLCCDAKLFTKIFALRMNKVIALVIHPDQVGFVQGRTSSDSSRRLLHLIWKSQHLNCPIAALSLDAEKAFDRVCWSYLHYALKGFGFGTQFQEVIKMIYANPKAVVTTNGMRSSQFTLERGTKQGDPLSPLLFIIALEPLAQAIRQSDKIKGISMGGRDNKLLIYADDILLLLSDPHESLPPLLDLINEFSKISGYKINWTKCEIMPLSKLCYKTQIQNWNFQWTPKNLKYLGILLNPGLENVIRDNFEPTINKISLLLQGWDKLQISLWGRAQAVKMIITPKLNYLFNLLPLTVPQSMFKTIDKMVSNFIWAGKRPRMTLKKLQAKTEYGGLRLPNMQLYKEAFTSAQIITLLSHKDNRPIWVDLETEINSPFKACDYLSQHPNDTVKSNPIMIHTRNVWHRLHRKENICPFLLGTASVWNNPKVKIGGKMFFWPSWYTKGIENINCFFQDNVLRTFTDLQNKYYLDNKDHWRFLQIRDCLSKLNRSKLTNFPIESSVYSVFKKIVKLPRLVSLIYNYLTERINVANLGLQRVWETDLGKLFEEDDWSAIVKKMLKPIRDARSKLIQFKILNRLYWTPVKLHRVGMCNSNICWRCKQSPGDMVHMFLTCPSLTSFWQRIMRKINSTLNLDLTLTPTLCLLNYLDHNTKLDTKRTHWLKIALTTAKRVLLRHWKGQNFPTYTEWYTALSETASYERLIYKINGQLEEYESVWEPFLTQIGKT